MFYQTPEGVEISLHVLPNAPKNQIVGIYDNKLKIKINAPPVDGKANKAIVELFSQMLGIPKSSVEIQKGSKSKTKIVLIRGIPLEVLQNHLLHNNSS